jgi:hypothetical protein
VSDAQGAGDDGINSISDQTGMDPGTIRSMPPGCFLAFIFIFALIGFAIYAGLGDATPSQFARESVPLDSPASPSAAPIINPPTTTQPSPGSGGTSTSAPASPTSTTPTSTSQAPPSQSTSTTTPPTTQPQPPPPTTTAPPPPPTTTVSCGYPSSITVSGGTNLSLPGSGGSFQVSAPPVSLSTGSLVDCGQGHYMLSWNYNNPDGSFGNGSDCQHTGFNDGVNGAEAGGSVSVTLTLPPNSCGP